MAGHGDKLRQQESFLAALLTQPTVAQAAKTAGISQATATRWLKDAPFAERYAEARRGMVHEAMRFLEQTMLAAAAVLRTVMLNDTIRPQTRVMAARSVLELGLRASELEDQERRITALEEALALREELRQ